MKKAFTIMEFLLVIFVIGVLVSVLAVSMSNGAEAANGAKCLANMRSLAIACQNYGMSNGGFPYAGSLQVFTSWTRETQTHAEHGWLACASQTGEGGYISPYSDNKEERDHTLQDGQLWGCVEGGSSVFYCPAHASYARQRIKGLKYAPLWSYAMNAWFGWNSAGKGVKYRQAVPYTSTPHTDRILLFAELPFREISLGSGAYKQTFSTSTQASTASDPILQYYQCVAGKGFEEIIGFNHRGAGKGYYANLVFADGHTEQLRLIERAQKQNLKELTRWLCRPDIRYDIGTRNNLYELVDASK